MKHIILIVSLLFLCISCKSSYSKSQLLAENKVLIDQINKLKTDNSLNVEAAIELKNMNVVYRGVSNPIYISKPNVLSFEASAPGLVKKDNNGNYVLAARSGNSVEIEIISKLKNGDSLTEIKTLRIKDIGKLNGTINRLGCGSKCEIKLTKEELANATVGVKVNDFLFDWNFVVTRFKLALNDKKILDFEGTQFNNSSKSIIEKLSVNDLVIVFDIRVKILGTNNYRLKNPAPIYIRIVE
jgi:hypothetical protein